MSKLKNLKELMEAKIRCLQETFNERLDGMEKATLLAHTALDYRLANMNEFRGILTDQTARLATREEMDLRLRSLEKAKSESDGKYKLLMVVYAAVASAVVGLTLKLLT